MQSSDTSPLRIVIVGHVDHGKSTLVGRLLYETGALPDGKFEQIKQSCDKRGMAFEWAFLMDALQAERDQNVTIDTTQIWFSSSLRRYCLIDAPGHREFLKNMITGAASADAALLLVDASEGLKEQSRRHALLLATLGISQVAVIINKMDLVDYSQEVFDSLTEQYTHYLAKIGVMPTAFVPIAARDGEGLLAPSSHMPWFKGKALMEVLDGFAAAPELASQPLRFAVQDVYRFDARRIIAGRIETGELKQGDVLHFAPSGLSAKVKSFAQWPEEAPEKTSAQAGESVGILLDEQIFVERGQVGHRAAAAPSQSNRFSARLFWLSDVPMQRGQRYELKIGHAKLNAEVKQVLRHYDIDQSNADADALAKYQVADVVIQTRTPIACDAFASIAATGRFMLMDGYQVAGGGILLDAQQAGESLPIKAVRSANIRSEDFEITPEARAKLNGHKGGVLWFTGLSGSGKSTLARELQKRLFAKGWQVMVLDGDNVRQGLCADLGFSATDRAENIRRVGEVASLFAEAGMMVITAFISPSREDRRRARAAAKSYFNEIYIKADVQTCESRDVKGLYKKARAGEIVEFTGISAPYDAPNNPDLQIDTSALTVEESAAALMDYALKHFSHH